MWIIRWQNLCRAECHVCIHVCCIHVLLHGGFPKCGSVEYLLSQFFSLLDDCVHVNTVFCSHLPITLFHFPPPFPNKSVSYFHVFFILILCVCVTHWVSLAFLARAWVWNYLLECGHITMKVDSLPQQPSSDLFSQLGRRWVDGAPRLLQRVSAHIARWNPGAAACLPRLLLGGSIIFPSPLMSCFISHIVLSFTGVQYRSSRFQKAKSQIYSDL